MSKANPKLATESIKEANKDSIAEGLVVQGYCNSVIAQPKLSFSGDDLKDLQTYEDKVNNTLKKAQAHANNYLGNIQPEIIKHMGSIDNYYRVHKAVEELPVGTTEKEKEDWLKALDVLKKATTKYEQEAREISSLLAQLEVEFNVDLDSFSSIVIEINGALKGDEGKIKDLDLQLKQIDATISAAQASMNAGILGTVEGVIVICVGVCVGAASGGAAGVPIFVGGVAVFATGMATTGKSGETISKFQDVKATIITEETTLKAEIVKLKQMESGYHTLKEKLKDSIDAVAKMERSWQNMGNQLDILANELRDGIISNEQVRKLMIGDAEASIKEVQADISIIKKQMAGITIKHAKQGESLQNLVNNTTKPTPQPLRLQTLTLSKAAPLLASSDDNDTAMKIYNANHTQSGQALAIQTYCNGIIAQPTVDFSGTATLSSYQKRINDGLKQAQNHAVNYLDKIQPAIIENISNINNYYQLHNAVATVLPSGSTKAQWIEMLTALKTQSEQYETAADNVVKMLSTLVKDLSSDKASFTKTVSDLNAAVEGDNGVLADLVEEIDSIDSEIEGVIWGAVTSGLAIAGGVFVTVAGGLSGNAVAAGVGVGIILIGAGGEVASALTLDSLHDQKAKAMQNKATLTAEVKLATSISSDYGKLSKQVGKAISAATGMKNAWSSLSGDLGNLADDLDKGIKSEDTIRKLFLTAANGVVKTVLTDIDTIKQQLSGVQTIVAPEGQSFGDAIIKVAEASSSSAKLLSATAAPRMAAMSLPQKMIMVAADDDEKNQIQTTEIMQIKESQIPRLTSFAQSVSKPIKSTSDTGLLSQSIDSLKTTHQEIRNINGLPGGAQSIQSSSTVIIDKIVAEVIQIQGNINDYTPRVLSGLNRISLLLDQNDASYFNEIQSILKILSDDTKSVESRVLNSESSVSSGYVTLKGNLQNLTTIESNLVNQRTELQGQLGFLQSKAEAAQQKYYYLIALGPFGLIGLSAALALYTSTKDEVDGYERQISSINSHISSINSMNSKSHDLAYDLTNIMNKVLNVKNALNFVGDDLLNVQSDLNMDDTITVIKLAVVTAISAVTTLKQDAA